MYVCMYVCMYVLVLSRIFFSMGVYILNVRIYEHINVRVCELCSL